MRNYLFFTSEGFTFDSNNKEIQNMQILELLFKQKSD